MKSIIVSLTLLITCSLQSQSVLTLDAGTTLGVLTGSDLCANTINGSGILYGGGTICGGLVSVEPIAENELPVTFGISQNYPNPFNPNTVINYQIPNSSYVSIKVYDQLGREVYDLFEGEQNAGFYRVTFEGTNLASGIYYYRITAYSGSNRETSFTSTKKMILIK
jgi:hypothetical protein